MWVLSLLNNSMINQRLIFYFPCYLHCDFLYNIDDEEQKLLYAKWIFQKCQTDRLYFSPFFFLNFIIWIFVINILFEKKKKTFNFISQVVKVKYNNSRYNQIVYLFSHLHEIQLFLEESPTTLIIHDTYLSFLEGKRLFHPMKRVFHWKPRVRSFENWWKFESPSASKKIGQLKRVKSNETEGDRKIDSFF